MKPFKYLIGIKFWSSTGILYGEGVTGSFNSYRATLIIITDGIGEQVAYQIFQSVFY